MCACLLPVLECDTFWIPLLGCSSPFFSFPLSSPSPDFLLSLSLSYLSSLSIYLFIYLYINTFLLLFFLSFSFSLSVSLFFPPVASKSDIPKTRDPKTREGI